MSGSRPGWSGVAQFSDSGSLFWLYNPHTSNLDVFFIIINRLDETHNFHVEHFSIWGHLEGVSGCFIKSTAEKLVRTSGRLPGLSGLYPDHPGLDPDHPASTFSFCCLGQFSAPGRMIWTPAWMIRPCSAAAHSFDCNFCIQPRIKTIFMSKSSVSTRQKTFLLKTFSSEAILIRFHAILWSDANTSISKIVISFAPELRFGPSSYLFPSSWREPLIGDMNS